MDANSSTRGGKINSLNAWAFSFACAIGWAAYVMPATVFLPLGGIPGSMLAFLTAAAVMSVIALNYHFLGNLYPENGGIYALVNRSISRPHAFAAAWSMGLAHLCCIPLNARAMGMLIRTILEEAFNIDFDVRFLGSETLLVEAVIVVLALILFGFINTRGIRKSAIVQTVGALLLLGGVVIILIASALNVRDWDGVFTPSYLPGTNASQAFMTIFILTPWAFVGFDSLSKVTSEVNFPLKKLGRIMVISVLCGAFAYVANILITLFSVPEGVAGWPEYLKQIRNRPGVAGYPVALAARGAMGRAGTVIFFVSCLSATLTGLVGFFASISRLVCQIAANGFLSPVFAELHPRYKTPSKAIWLVVVLALLLSLLRSAFDFIEQLASVATAVGYGYCSIAAMRCAVRRRSWPYICTGGVGLAACLFWTFFLLVPVKGFSSAITKEAMICVVGWVFMGITFYVVSTRPKNGDILSDTKGG